MYELKLVKSKLINKSVMLPKLKLFKGKPTIVHLFLQSFLAKNKCALNFYRNTVEAG